MVRFDKLEKVDWLIEKLKSKKFVIRTIVSAKSATDSQASGAGGRFTTGGVGNEACFVKFRELVGDEKNYT
jgi:hypothetical protein